LRKSISLILKHTGANSIKAKCYNIMTKMRVGPQSKQKCDLHMHSFCHSINTFWGKQVVFGVFDT